MPFTAAEWCSIQAASEFPPKQSTAIGNKPQGNRSRKQDHNKNEKNKEGNNVRLNH